MLQSKTPQHIEDYYFHCDDCDETVDFWKYNHISDTGHQGHKTRNLTEQETINAVQSCADVHDEKNFCLNEEFISSVVTFRQSQLGCIIKLIQEGIKQKLSRLHQGDSITDDSFVSLICTKEDIEERLKENGYRFLDIQSASKAWDITKHKMTDILMDDFWGAIDSLEENYLQEFIKKIKGDKQ